MHACACNPRLHDCCDVYTPGIHACDGACLQHFALPATAPRGQTGRTRSTHTHTLLLLEGIAHKMGPASHEEYYRPLTTPLAIQTVF